MQTPEPASAQTRFRQAFERLKQGKPKVLPQGTVVTQNNVAREAGCDPSALKKARFPALVREIKTYVNLQKPKEEPAIRKAVRQKATKRSTEQRLVDTIAQRDMAQSRLVSANARIVELTDELQSVQRKLDELLPAPKNLGR
jgi:hypothetical protein